MELLDLGVATACAAHGSLARDDKTGAVQAL